jgi:hypothetical protein
MTAEVQVSMNLTYPKQPEPPIGARAAWEADEFAIVAPAKSLTVQADLGSVTLGRGSPWAARHVLLRASAPVLNDPAGINVTAFVTREPSAEEASMVVVTVVPDDPRGEPVEGATILGPFDSTCGRDTACERGVTIFARWVGQDPDGQVDLSWSYHVLAAFTGTGIPPGATLTAEVDKAIDLGPKSPRLHGQAAGSLKLEPDGSGTSGLLRLGLTAPDLGNAFLGDSPPAVAVLRLRAAVKDGGTPAGLYASAWVPYGRTDDIAIADDGTETQVVVLPFGTCGPGRQRSDH